MDSLPAPCPGDHWPRGCGDGSPAAPTPGRCASCCPRARRRRWPRGRWPCAATPPRSSTPPRYAWRPWCPRSGAAAAGTRRSPTCCAASRPPGTARASGSSTTRAATRARARPRPRRSSRSSSGRSRVPCASASAAGRARTWPWPPAGRPSRRSCGCRGRARAPTWCRTTSPSSTPRPPSASGPRGPTGQGLHCIAASPWLADLVRTRYGASATSFDLGIDHARYRPAEVERRRGPRALLRARRHAAPGRAARPAGAGRSCIAAGRRSRSRSSARRARWRRPFPHRALGVLEPERAGAGLLGGDRRPRAVADQPVAHPAGDAGLRAALRRPDQREHARHLRCRRSRRRWRRPSRSRCARRSRRCSTTPRRRARRAADGLRWAAARTWPAAAAQVQEGLRAAVREAAQP